MGVDHSPVLAFGVPVTVEELQSQKALKHLKLEKDTTGYTSMWLEDKVGAALSRSGLKIVDASNCLGDYGHDLLLAVRSTYHEPTIQRIGGTGKPIKLQLPTDEQVAALKTMQKALGVKGKPQWWLGVKEW